MSPLICDSGELGSAFCAVLCGEGGPPSGGSRHAQWSPRLGARPGLHPNTEL